MAPNPPAPDDERCEALVRGHPGWNPPHDKDHRCKRRANQMRGLPSDVRVIKVCFQHATAKTIEEYKMEVCGRCNILIRPEGGHLCGDCGRDI